MVGWMSGDVASFLGLAQSDSNSDSDSELAKLHCPSSKQDTWTRAISQEPSTPSYAYLGQANTQLTKYEIQNTTKKLFKIPHTNRCSGRR